METGAFYYPWYDKSRHWSAGTIMKPLLGYYSSKDDEIVKQHEAWALRVGIRHFLSSWWGIDTFEDICFRNNLSSQSKPMKYCIIYESNGLLALNSTKIDLDDDQNRHKFSADFSYLSNEYFSSPNYYKINGRPVIFLYLSRIYKGDIRGVMQRLRDECIKNGENPFLIGDEIYWFKPSHEDVSRLQNFDALSLYNPHISDQEVINEFWKNLDKLYDFWHQFCNENGLSFIPTLIPGFDDTAVRPLARHPIIPRNMPKFYEYLHKYKSDLRFNHLIICSWNEWHENTQIEPENESVL